jgi:predicted hotdog family 3-hydroxylacyl-ACP dehydratase
MNNFPPVAEVLPHAGEMVLLTEVVYHDDEETHCRADIDTLSLFHQADGSVGAWVGVELMAQCIAARAGLVARSKGEPPEVGFLLGSRRVRFTSPRFRSGESLLVKAAQSWGQSSGMVAFDCSIEDCSTKELLAEARLNCFLPGNIEEITGMK